MRNVTKNSRMVSFISDLPSPSMLSYMWSYGSLLGVMLVVQIFSGVFLVMHYSCSVDVAFVSVIHIMRDVNWGWLMRVAHSNGASLFFLFIYIHMGRGFYYGGYLYKEVWLSGVSIFLVSMGVAFLGYVLPWGQMSFWAATVITNLLSAVPYVGGLMVEWVWGGFAVGDPTLTRFFCLHYFLPFLVAGLVMVHLVMLHKEGSGNPMGVFTGADKVSFHVLFTVSDVVGVIVVMYVLVFVSLEWPYVFMDGENFIEANSLVTPVHIQPEWYFLFAYSILRSVPSKLGGVVSLGLSVLVVYVFPWLYRLEVSGVFGSVVVRGLFWWFVVVWINLTWNGACEVIFPYVGVGQVYSVMYFFVLGVMGVLGSGEEWLVN